MQTFLFQARENEAIQSLPRPVGLLYRRNRLRLRCYKGPIVFPLGALLYPSAQELDLFGGKRRRMIRHPGFGVFGGDPGDQL